MKKVKINNEGFSLVELIIVIAIMAILAAALAPQLIKYIDNSRKSTDVSTGQSIATAVSVALANEAAYNAVAGSMAVSTSDEIWVSTCFSGATGDFESKVGDIIGAAAAADTPKPKYRGIGTADFDDFAIVITKDASNNVSFAIYPATNVSSYAGIADDMVYPTVGAHYVD